MTTQEITAVTTPAPEQFEGYRLTTGEYHATVAKIAKVNERATKRGFTGRLEVVAERKEVTQVDPLTGINQTSVVYITRVEGEAPSYGGWVFLARVDRVGKSFTVATAPGVDHVDRTLVQPGVCEHCGFDRQRNNTYVVRNEETGQVVNVGSTCIKDFLGWSANVVFFGEGDSSLEPEQGVRFATPEFSLDTVLAYAYAATRAFGWVASSAFSYTGRPTAEWVRLGLGLFRPTKQEENDLGRLREFAAEAESKVAEIRAYITSDDFAGQSSYVDNLKAVFEQDVVGVKQIGLVASAPQALIRHQEKQAERKAEATKTADSDFVGQPKDKVEVKGTIEAVRFIDGDYGTTTLYTILGEDGNLFKWFSTNGALGEQAGVQVHIRGTVKKHDEYRGTKSTVLTRCKAL